MGMENDKLTLNNLDFRLYKMLNVKETGQRRLSF